jgi:hypothetical protein
MLYLTHQPNALATAAVYLSAREEGVRLPDVAWWEVFDVEREALGFLVVGMGSLEGFVESERKRWEQGEEKSEAVGIITRSIVREEIGRLGLGGVANGKGVVGREVEMEDEEAEMARMLDEKVAAVAGA